MKKLSTLLLALIATTALWAADFTVDGIAYNILGGDSVEVTSKSPDYSGAITIPASVTYESTTYRVTGIGEWAFSKCSSLTSISIPNSVNSIGRYAFYECTSLTSIAIPNSITSIGDDAIRSCTSLTSITIPNSVTSIGERAFEGCTSLTIVNIPNSVTRIGAWAFLECTSLTTIAIPNSVTSIGDYAFRYCDSLSSITVDAGNTHYASVDGVLFSYAKDTIIQYPMGSTRTTYTIPNSVTSIGVATFSNCTSLTSITIPNSVASIGEQAFYRCTSLTSIAIPNSVTTIGERVFTYCTSLISISIPNSVTTIGERAFGICKSLSSVTIGNRVTSIGACAFEGCTSLTSFSCYATTPPICGSYCFSNITKSIPLYVPAGSIDAYKAAYEWKDFTNIQAIAAEEVTEPVTTVVTIPNDNSVTITWPTTTGADTYTINIKKGNNIFCTLTFNAQGQLLNIIFMAPSRGSNNNITMAEEVVGGYRFTITGLDPGTMYDYEVDTKNAEGQSIANHTGSFSTKGTPIALDQLTDSPINRFTKFLHDGHLLIQQGNHLYTPTGTELQ